MNELCTMVNRQFAWNHIIEKLGHRYDKGESRAMARWMLEDVSGKEWSQHASELESTLREDQWKQIQEWTKQVLSGRPFHYVLGYQIFCGHRFQVNESVLIPRPETEELVGWMLDSESLEGKTLWDLGTGSGCIPISLQKAVPGLQASGSDLSKEALNLARQNAQSLEAKVGFRLWDMRDEREDWPESDLLVSNPPYIPDAERSALEEHVRDHEPSMALFVPDQDPLLFYKIIARRGRESLRPKGCLYLETHRDLAEDVRVLLMGHGYEGVELKSDFSGHPRMVRAYSPSKR